MKSICDPGWRTSNVLQPVDYLSPDVPGQLPWYDVPLVVASVEGLAF